MRRLRKPTRESVSLVSASPTSKADFGVFFSGSLQLLYYFGVLVFSRAAWDAVALEDPVVVSAGQRACLQAATDLVEFVESLTLPDLLGYWSSRSSLPPSAMGRPSSLTFLSQTPRLFYQPASLHWFA